MSPDRPPTSSECGGTVIDSINGDMVQQELIIEHQPHVIEAIQAATTTTTANRQSIYYTTDSMNTIGGSVAQTASMAAPPTASKLVIVQQSPSSNTGYIKETSDGKVVLVATEQMLLNYSSDKHGLNGTTATAVAHTTGADEDLTSLTWLHDSNLLRAVDGSKTIRHLQPGNISPTSDFLEDSCISEENGGGSSATSNSDQGISIYCTETAGTPTKVYHYTQHHPHNNNNVSNKNFNHNKSDGLIKPPAIMHLSLAQPIDKSSEMVKVINGNASASINKPMANELVLDCSAANKNGCDANGQHQSQQQATSATPHQHFHKKYLREEHNKVMQQLNAETTVTCTTSNGTIISNALAPGADYEMETTTIIQQADSPQPHVTFISHSAETSPIKIPTSPSSPGAQNKQKHPQNLPYDPFVHTNNKPPLSFSSLIFLAIEDAKEKALPVKEIYSWIIQHYPYFKTAPTGWKNSVRHNLSLNKCFQKVEKAPNMGKGSLWRVEQQYKQNLIQALTRSAYHPGSTNGEDKFSSPAKAAPRSNEAFSGLKAQGRPFDAELFPRLSKYMADISNGSTANGSGGGGSSNGLAIASNISERTNPIVVSVHQLDDRTANGNDNNSSNSDVMNSKDNYIASHEVNVKRIAQYWGVDSIDDVNAATAMLALKHGPKVFSEAFQTGTPIITSVPSEDHTYSAGGGGGGNRTNNMSPINQIASVEIVNISVNNTSDNASNGTSSDAAYESSEESQPHVTEMDLEARRHQEGVDAFLSFATEVSSMSSPIKRPLSTDRIVDTMTNGYYYYYDDSSPSSTISSASSVQPFSVVGAQQAYLSSPSPPKKSRSRNLRTKLKKKAWFH